MIGISKRKANEQRSILRSGRAGLALLSLVMSACSGTDGIGDASTNGALTSPGDDSGVNYGLSGDDVTTFQVQGPVGGPFPDGQRPIVLSNNSPDVIRWRAEATIPWLTFSQTEGGLPGGSRKRIVVGIDTTVANQLPAGEYFADIYFRNRANPTDHVQIEFILTVFEDSGDARMLVTPEEGFRAHGQVGGDDIVPQSKTYRISNLGAEAMDYQVSSTHSWVTLSGETTGQIGAGDTRDIEVSFDSSQVSNFDEGEHDAVVEFRNTTNERGNSRRRVELELEADGRVTAGLRALYSFDGGAGGVVHDESGVGQPLDLVIEDQDAAEWLPGSLSMVSPTRLLSQGPASKIIDACRQSGEVTLEAWIRPANVDQDGPARIMTLSDGAYDRNFTLGQGRWGNHPSEVFDVRLRTTNTDNDGKPSVTSPTGSATTNLMHVVYTRKSGGQARIFIDGQVAVTEQVGGDLSNWASNYRLSLANEIGTGRPWMGTFHLVAIYDRALSESEVETNYNEGTQDPGVGFLTVTPGSNFNSEGVEGGNFSPSSKTYNLENTGEETLVWSVQTDENWADINGSTTGTLNPGQDVDVTIELEMGRVQGFSPGTYNAVASFFNTSNGYGDSTRDVRVRVNPDGGGGGGEGGDKPGPHNTGPSDPDILTNMSGLTVTTDGLTFENVNIQGNVNVAANNITFRNFRANAGGAPFAFRMDYGKHGILFEDGEIFGMDSAALYGGGFTARRLNLHDSGHDAIKSMSNVVVENCWIHSLGLIDDAHADGNQTRNGSNLIFRYNNFDMPIDDGGPYKSNACLINMTAVGPIDNYLMEGNWLNGGNYTVYFDAKDYGNPTNVRVINNRFGRDYRYGPWRADGDPWVEGNIWDDTEELMDINNH